MSPPHIFFIFELKMVRFGAFWVLIFCYKITELVALKKLPPVMRIKLFPFS